MDKSRGIYRKYKVERVDQSEKHGECEYFVLDPKHDIYARAALRAYADACETDGYVALSKDIDTLLERTES